MYTRTAGIRFGLGYPCSNGESWNQTYGAVVEVCVSPLDAMISTPIALDATTSIIATAPSARSTAIK
ncbi:hypothetical protein FRC01_013701, partial [Tulasnella sp. 417]